MTFVGLDFASFTVRPPSESVATRINTNQALYLVFMAYEYPPADILILLHSQTQALLGVPCGGIFGVRCSRF